MITLIQPRVTLPSPPEHLKRSACNLEIWWMTLKNNMAHLLYIIKLYASFQSHMWIQTGVTVRKCSIRVKIGDFFVPCELEIWWMTLETNKAPLLYYIKLWASFQLQSGKAQFESKLVIFCPAWPWNLTNDIGKQQSTSSILYQTLCTISNPSMKPNLSYSPEKLNSSQYLVIFCPAWPWNLTNDLGKQQGTSSILH